jgi:Protein of unknown function (DUF1360)
MSPDSKGKVAQLHAGHDHSDEQAPDPRPLRGYAVLLGTYSLGATLAIALLRDRRAQVRKLDFRTLLFLAIATQHLSRLIAKDSITSVLRSPFTRFVEATGEGEVNEEVIGEGLRHAIGELITCPFCISQWVAAGLVASTLAAPNFTAALTTVCTLARTNDYLQLAYDHVKNNA